MSTKTSLMRLKVVYTFDSEQMFLSRSSANFKIKYGELDISDTETRLIGVVKLRSCIQTVLKSSPELLSQLQTKYDYNVYIWDYSEYNSPLVSYGLLSNLLNTGYSPNSNNSSAANKTKEIIIPGKVESSIASLTSSENQNHSMYLLRIQLKFRQIDLDPNTSFTSSSMSQIQTIIDTDCDTKIEADGQQNLMIKKPIRLNTVRSTNHNPAPRATRTYSMPVTLLNHGITRSFSSSTNAHDTITSKGITYHMTDDALKINRKLSSGTVTTADDDEFLRLAAAKASKKQSKKKPANETRKSKKSKITINRKLPNISNTNTMSSSKQVSENKMQSKNYWVIKNNISKASTLSPKRLGKPHKNWNSAANLNNKNTSFETLDIFENKENIPPFNLQQSAPYSMLVFPNGNNVSSNQFNLDSDLGSDATAVFQVSSSPQAIESSYTNNSTSSPTSASSSPVQTSSPAITLCHNQNDSRFEIRSDRNVNATKTSSFSPNLQLMLMEAMPTSDTSISDDTSIVMTYAGKKELEKDRTNIGINGKIRKSAAHTVATISSGISHTELEELFNFNSGLFIDSLYPAAANDSSIHNEETSIITPEDHAVHTLANGNNYTGTEDKTPKDFGEALTPILEGAEDSNYSRQSSMNDKTNSARLSQNKQNFEEIVELAGLKDGFMKGSPKLNKDSTLACSPFTVYDQS